MIITVANEFVGKVHDRMPVLLEPIQFSSWLSGNSGYRDAHTGGNGPFAGMAGIDAGEQFAHGDDDPTLSRRMKRTQIGSCPSLQPIMPFWLASIERP
jgi:hypothetical protein